MEGVYKELEDLRSAMEVLKEEYQSKSSLANNLRRAHDEHLARFQEAKAEIAKQARDISAKDEEISLTKRMYEDLRSSFAEKEAALKHLGLASENLKISSKEKEKNLEAENRAMVSALDEANTKREEQGRIICGYKEEIEGLKRLLSASQRKCLDAEERAQAAKEVKRRDELLLKFEEEKGQVEDRLKWKIEQFRHLEEAHENLQNEFRAEKKEWGVERSKLVEKIHSLQTNLDSQTRVSENLQSQLKICNQALAHEESRRKMLEAQVSESRLMYDNVVSEYEDARSTIELLTAKRDEDIASLRSSLAGKAALLKEMGFRKAQLEQENDDLRLSLKEYQEAQINGAHSAGSLKSLRQKFRALEQVHKSCTEKLKAREIEWRTQMAKLGKDLDECLNKLNFKDRQLRHLREELECSYTSLVQQKLENEETSSVLMVVKSKFKESCIYLNYLKLEMEQHSEKLRERVAAMAKQLEDKNTALVQARAENINSSETTGLLHSRIEYLESIELDYSKMQTELDAYKQMLDNALRNLDHFKDEAAKKENSLQEDLRKASDALDLANCCLSERNSELNQVEFNLEQQKLIVERLLKLKTDMEIEIKRYHDENQTISRELESRLLGKMESEEALIKEKERSGNIIAKKDRRIEELNQHIALLQEDNARLETANLVRLEAKKTTEEENRRILETARDMEMRLMEIKSRLDSLEQNFISRECEISRSLEKEKANWFKVIEQKENAIAIIQQIVESLRRDITQSVEAAGALKLAEKQLEIRQINDALQKIVAANVVEGHDIQYKNVLIVEMEKEIGALQLKLKLEEEKLANSKSSIEEVKAEIAVERLENQNEQFRLLNEIRNLQSKNRSLEDQLAELNSKTKPLRDLITNISAERKEFIGQMMGFSDLVAMMFHVDNELKNNWEKVMQKAVKEEAIKNVKRGDWSSSEKANVRNFVSPLMNKATQVSERRLPLKEQN
ncbi:uncharacterized protein At4g38062 [Typha latifolia]|uniref:uncharacterized protein At4g38062 n=1 Tax=Typha latifolia TaxID=4733 RepID=UPI003C2F6AF5